MAERKDFPLIAQAKRLKKLSRKGYREAYVPGRIRASIALQVRILRKKAKLSQKALALRMGKQAQSDISDLENPDGEQVTVQTLLDAAAALDVGLVVRFVSFPDFIKLMSDMTPEGLGAENIHDTMKKLSEIAPDQSGASTIDLAKIAQGPAGEANTWQTTNLQTLISLLKESLQTNFPSGEQPDLGMSMQIMLASGQTSSILQ